MAKLLLFRGGSGMDRLTIFDVALAFLAMGSMTNKKLQKLCYYAQAWCLALYREPLFDSNFEAWVHGPVCPDLYRRYKDYGWVNIPKEENTPKNVMASDKYDLLITVYDTYGGFTGDELEALTHSELPWNEARKGLEEWEPSNNIISDKTMHDFYWKLYESNQND